MNKSLIIKTLLGLAVSAFSVSVASAQTTITDNVGDLTLGFYARSGTGAAESVMVDLGPVTKFLDATGTISLTGTNGLNFTDLTSTFGSASDSALYWGIVAGNATTAIPGANGIDNVWITQPESPAGTAAAEIPGQTKNTLAGASLAGETFNLALNTATSTANSNVTIVTSNSLSNSYESLDTAQGTNFVQFDGRLPLADNNIANASASGDEVSDLEYIIPPSSGGPLTKGSAAITIGKFDFNPTTDTLTYTPSSPVPEPSSIGLTGVGFLSLIGFVALRRRRSVIA